MSVWTAYEARLGASNNPKRESDLTHAQSRMLRKLSESLSYKSVIIGEHEQQVAIIDESDFSIKKIFSLPGEDLEHGALVKWDNSVWLITEINAHKEMYTEGRMERCNHVLKWIDNNGFVIERWCIVEDGTKYLIGEKQKQLITIGDARIAVTIGKDKDTNCLCRGMRFLIDDADSESVLAYQITKPNKLFNVYDGKGVFRFILNEVNVTDNDNLELRIADYHNWEPKKKRIESDVKESSPLENPAVFFPEGENAEIDDKGWI